MALKELERILDSQVVAVVTLIREGREDDVVDRDAVVHADSLVELQYLRRLVDRLGFLDVSEGPAVTHEFEASREAEVAPEADPAHLIALRAVLLERRP